MCGGSIQHTSVWSEATLALLLCLLSFSGDQVSSLMISSWTVVLHQNGLLQMLPILMCPAHKRLFTANVVVGFTQSAVATVAVNGSVVSEGCVSMSPA